MLEYDPWRAIRFLLKAGHRPKNLATVYEQIGISTQDIRYANFRHWGYDVKSTPVHGVRCVLCRRRHPIYKTKMCEPCYREWNRKGYAKGEDHYCWKGGRTQDLKSLNKSPQYKKWRKAVMERDGHKCVLCGETNPPFEVDHIIPLAARPILRFSVWNGRTLCEICHKRTPTFGTGALRARREMRKGVICFMENCEDE